VGAAPQNREELYLSLVSRVRSVRVDACVERACRAFHRVRSIACVPSRAFHRVPSCYAKRMVVAFDVAFVSFAIWSNLRRFIRFMIMYFQDREDGTRESSVEHVSMTRAC
jgi:hypothetical protein